MSASGLAAAQDEVDVDRATGTEFTQTANIEVIQSFDHMGLNEDLLRGIYAYGFEKPSAIQQRAIRPIIAGRDVIAQSQSGTGKTAVFCIGALQVSREGQLIRYFHPVPDRSFIKLQVAKELGEQFRVLHEYCGRGNAIVVHLVMIERNRYCEKCAPMFCWCDYLLVPYTAQ